MLTTLYNELSQLTPSPPVPPVTIAVFPARENSVETSTVGAAGAAGAAGASGIVVNYQLNSGVAHRMKSMVSRRLRGFWCSRLGLR